MRAHLLFHLVYPRPPRTGVGLGLLGVFSLLLLLASPARGAFLFSSLDPARGPAGTMVTLQGTGLTPGGAYTVEVGGVPATGVVATATTLTFTTTPAMGSGPITVSLAQETASPPFPWVATRILPGQFNPPPNVTLAGYRVSTGATLSEPLPAGGAFTLEVPQDVPVVVWAIRGSADPAFLALVTSATQTITLDASSTALALAYLNPAVASPSDSRAIQIANSLSAKPAVASLSARLATLSADGVDYLDDALVENYLTQLASSFLAGSTFTSPRHRAPSAGEDPLPLPTGTRLKPINRQGLLLPAPDLIPELKSGPAEFPEKVIFSLSLPEDPENAGDAFTPLDWTIEIFQLNETFFTEGFSTFLQMDGNSLPTRLSNTPVHTGFFRAKLNTARLDYFGTIAGYIWENTLGTFDQQFPTNEFVFNGAEPGIYVAQATSGNLFYGTNFFVTPPTSQSDLLLQVDPNAQWEYTLGSNILIASIDLAGVFLELKSILAFDDPGYLNNLLKNLGKAVLAYRSKPGGLTRAEIYDLVQTTCTTLIKNLLERQLQFDEEGQGPGTKAAIRVLGEKIGGTIVQSINILGKVSDAAQALERTGGLLSPGTYALERTAFTIGDPFQPAITGFSPSTAREGEIVVLQGFKFPTSTTGLIVTFCQFSGTTTDPDATSATVSLPAEVLSTRANSMFIRVPAGWETVFSGNQTYLCIQQGQKKGDTRPLGDAGIFRFLGPPVLTSTLPAKVFPGDTLFLRGTSISPDRWREQKVFIDDTKEATVIAVHPDSLQVVLPADLTAGQHSVVVKVGAKSSNVLTFDVELSFFDPGPAGKVIYISKADMSNEPDDGHISIFEAFALAGGTLGRGLRDHDPCELLPANDPGKCPRQVREVDYVFPLDPGASTGDVIYFQDLFDGQTVVLTQPLPKLSSGDRVSALDLVFNPSGPSVNGGSLPIAVTLNGSGLPTGTPGLDLDGLTGVKVENLTLDSFPGHGVTLRDGAVGATLSRLTIKNAFANGVYLAGSSRGHRLLNLTIENAGLDGVLLEDGPSRNVLENLVIKDPSASGIHFLTAAEGNVIENPRVESAGLHGLRLNGPGVRANVLYFADPLLTGPRPYGLSGRFLANAGWGILLEKGAHANTLAPLVVQANTLGGICLQDPGTSSNAVGPAYKSTLLNPLHTLVFDNLGPGLRLGPGASDNRCFLLNIAGTTGDAVLLEGAATTGNVLAAIWTGLKYFNPETGAVLDPPVAAPNTGHGLHLRDGAHHNFIGDRNLWSWNPFANSIVNNQGDGIHLSGPGTSYNRIHSTFIGDPSPAAFYHKNAGLFTPNGRHGVALLDGASFNQVGDSNQANNSYIFACPDAAVFISGANTAGNIVTGLNIGYNSPLSRPDTEGANRLGVHLANGAHGNRIGLDGTSASLAVAPFHQFRFGNRISYCTEAGILLESCGSPTDPNRIENNEIGIIGTTTGSGNEVGLKITGLTSGNIIGGPRDGQGNNFYNNHRAGIWIQHNTIPNPASRNRILNNLISNTGDLTTNPPAVDPLQTPPHGVGLLISGANAGVIVGETFQTDNTFTAGQVGAYLDNTVGVTLRGNRFNSNDLTGATVRSGGQHILGGLGPAESNEFNSNGQVALPGAGLVLVNTSGNLLQSSLLNFNKGDGLRLLDSGANHLGGGSLALGNAFLVNTGHGLYLSGTGSTLNRIAGNRMRNNSLDGIHCANGASSNEIGSRTVHLGVAVPLGNIIDGNTGAGIQVAAGNGNRILDNSIFNNGGKGILLSGGNHGLAPPPNATFDFTSLSGTFPDTAAVPAGSRVQAFVDLADEGEIVLGEALTRANGSWTITGFFPPVRLNITLTLTHATTGSTSEFGPLSSTVGARGFTLALAPQQPDPALHPVFGSGDIPVVAFLAEALKADVAVQSLTFTASGTLSDPAFIDGLYLYRDSDRNGILTNADLLLGGPATFSADDGSATLTFDRLNLLADQPQRWILAVRTDEAPPAAATLILTLPAAEAVSASFRFPVGTPAVPVAAFPLISPTLQVRPAGGDPSDPVEIVSPALLAALRTALNKPTGTLTRGDLALLTTLDLSGLEITTLAGLEAATLLETLEADANRLITIHPLAALSALRFLDLSGNRIHDLTPLENLSELRQLWLQSNRIQNIAPLQGLAKLADDAVRSGPGLDLTSNLLNLSPGSATRTLLDTLDARPGLTVLYETQTRPRDQAQAIWQAATGLDSDWFFRPGFGLFNVTHFPWIYHEVHGWMLVSGLSDTEGLWYLNGSLGWIWSSGSTSGWFYSPARSTWIYFERDAQGQRWFYDFALKSWFPANP